MHKESDITHEGNNQLHIQYLQDAAICTDAGFTITGWNKAAENLFGYHEQEVLGRDIALIIPSHLQGPSIKYNHFTEGITEQITRAKQIIRVYTSVYTMTAPAGAAGYLVIFRSSGEYIKARQEMHSEQEEKYRQLIEEYQKKTEQLRELSDHLENIRETERINISREIHDELGQQMTILKMDISWLHFKLKDYSDTAVVQRMDDTVNLLNETIKTVRRIATELRPSMLNDLGLVAAMEWQSREFENRSGIKIVFEPNVSIVPAAPSVATSLFRIYQEALTNAGRHAKANHVFCRLQLMQDEITLTIKDDGQGFDMQTLAHKKTLGILGMKERTLMMKGHFDITSAPGEGTTIVVTTLLQ
jgi:signal transduction histidine kinase